MKLSDVLGTVVPINSYSRPRPSKEPPVPVPAVGARLGRPSAFSYSTEAALQSGGDRDGKGGDGAGGGSDRVLPANDPAEYMRVLTSEVKIISKVVRVEDPAEPETWTDVDRMERMMFYFTQFPAKRTRGSVQPSFTTYYDLHFDLHPSTEDEVPS